MAKEISLDSQYDEEQDVTVKSSRDMYRYRKRYKQEDTDKGRKQARFHIKDKDLSSGDRRD
jgi:hypothetical protein